MGVTPSAASAFVLGACGAVVGLALGALLWAGGASSPPSGPDRVADEALLAELRELTGLLRDERERAARGLSARAGAAPAPSPAEPLDLPALEQAARVSAALGTHVAQLTELLDRSPATSLSRVADPAVDQAAAAMAELAALYGVTPEQHRAGTRDWFGATVGEVRARLGVPDFVWHGDGKVRWEYQLAEGGLAQQIVVHFLDGYAVSVGVH